MERRIRLRYLAGVTLAVIFVVLTLVHIYWAAGGTIGIAVAIPTVNGVRVFSPSPSSALLVALALFAASLISAGSVGLLGKSIPPTVYRVLLSLVGLAFVVRTIGDFRLYGFFKPANSSAFAFYDTVFYSPLCLFIASAAFLVAIRRK